jgi:hypothetical protein
MLGFWLGDAFADFAFDGKDESGGALMMAGWGGMCEEGLWDRSAIAAR